MSTTPGLEPALRNEVRSLGFSARLTAGGVEVEGPEGCREDANLHLRTATRVLLRVAQVDASSERSLKAALKRVDLRPFGERFEVEAVVHRARMRAGWVESLAREVLPAGPGPMVQVRVDGSVATVSVDTSGERLHVRGYRQEIGRAPLRETLAAGMLLFAGYDGNTPLWDAMCGSGTIAIEAALLAARRAPGIARSFAFESFPCHDARRWESKKEAARRIERRPPQPIFATDLNAGALGTARRNARRAGALDWLTLERRDAVAGPPASTPGLLVANLPYGKRVGSRSDLPQLYRMLGGALKALAGWRYALLVADTDAERHLEIRPERVHALRNGGIRCRLLVGGVGGCAGGCTGL